jgi:hypothetical protein
MQNLKSLNNLLTPPVWGANDDALAMVGHKKVEIYSYADETNILLRQIDEPHRKALSRELLTDSKQD